MNADGTIADATPAAMRLLGGTLEELRTAPPGAFSSEAPNPEADTAFREAWDRSGAGSIAGRATVRRLDGLFRRVRYLIVPRPDGRFEAVLEPIEEDAGARPTTVVIGEVLAAWRAAERSLEDLEPGSPESEAVQAEIKALRDRYQDLFELQKARGSA